MALGVIFGETSTREFAFLFGDSQELEQSKLKFAYVQVNLDDANIAVARVIDVNTENPLLGRDTAKFYSEGDTTGIRFPDLMSRRFTLYQAKCEVIGQYNGLTATIEPLTQPIKPGVEVKPLTEDILNQLFSADEQWHLRLGYVETPGRQSQAQVSLNADSIITMHACVFGMTGMGKTTTTAVLLEELMFRGAKTIVFDPHSDYTNINRINHRLYSQFFKEKVETDENLRRKIEEYRELLKNVEPATVDPWKNIDPSFNNLTSEEINEELTYENVFYRLLNVCVIRDPRLMIDSSRNPQELGFQIDDVITSIMHLNLQTDLPETLARRKLTIKLNVFPTLRMYPEKGVYFTLRLIEAIAGEAFSPAQQGFLFRWLSGLTDLTLSNLALLNFLRTRVNALNDENPSKVPLTRIIARAIRTIHSLVQRNCSPLNLGDFVEAFCKHNRDLSNVSTAVFNLSDLENNHVRRALVYAVMEFAFDEYKSRRFVMGENAHPILFAIEEARTLIPRQEESNSSGEMHPATRAARLAARQIATEGRKMGLGMLVISQRPASVDPLTVSQANTLILHRAINPEDQSYIRTVGEGLSAEDLETLKTVKEGVAIVSGDALKTRMSTLVKIRNRYSEPGTEKPRPIRALWTD
ncbi:MAG: DUF87 domain-containing protein [Candidatus Poribacteria bacterium]|nr:DUF87 domain-containing protein [Candidatus Poribacteria bacterium]